MRDQLQIGVQCARHLLSHTLEKARATDTALDRIFDCGFGRRVCQGWHGTMFLRLCLNPINDNTYLARRNAS